MQLLVGTYSATLAGMESSGEGIYAVAFDRASGAFGPPQLRAKCVNPSALALHAQAGVLFASREVYADDQPALLSFQIDAAGQLDELSTQPIAGELPCQLTYEPNTGRLASAQYGTGDVALCSAAAGGLQQPASYLTRTGSGPNAARQEGPHAHCTAFSDGGQVLHLADLGTDSIVSHRLSQAHQAQQTATLQLPAGSGPRHIVLDAAAERAFVVCELDESLISLRRAGLGWQIDGVTAGFERGDGIEGAAAAIRLSADERHVYISGRRQSRIAHFAVDGAVRRVGDIGSGGLCPREFIVTADGNWLIAANQNSNNLASFRRNQDTGQLASTGHACAIGSPVALVELAQ